LPKCRATAILNISSPVTPVSITARMSSRLPLNFRISCAKTVSLLITSLGPGTWHPVMNALKWLVRKITRGLVSSDDQIHGRRDIRLRQADWLLRSPFTATSHPATRTAVFANYRTLPIADLSFPAWRGDYTTNTQGEFAKTFSRGQEPRNARLYASYAGQFSMINKHLFVKRNRNRSDRKFYAVNL
jgi:hypothetical protein